MAHAVPAHLYLVFDMHDVLEGKTPKLYLNRDAAIEAARAHIQGEYQGGEIVVEMLRSLDASAATSDGPQDQVIAAADYEDCHVWVMPCPVEGRPTLYMGEHEHRHGSSFYLLEGENLTEEHFEALVGDQFEPDKEERLHFGAADPIILVDDTVLRARAETST